MCIQMSGCVCSWPLCLMSALDVRGCCFKFFHIFFFMDQDEAVKQVVEFMNAYSISQEDFDTVVELSKFQVPSTSIAYITYVASFSVVFPTYFFFFF